MAVLSLKVLDRNENTVCVKSGEDFAKVEGVFSVDLDNEKLNEILKNVDIENEGTDESHDNAYSTHFPKR